jgi:hypothetical protein
MFSKISTLSLLLGSTQAALTRTVSITSAAGVSPLTASDYPLYVAQTTDKATMANFNNNGYACIRNGYTYIFPATSASNAIGTGSTKTFYPRAVAELGTAGVAADNGSGCCPDTGLTNANCAIAIKSDGSKIALRIGYGGGAIASTLDGFNFNTDFLLASTYQDSWDGIGSRGTAPANYCDVQVATAIPSTKTTAIERKTV